MTLNTSYKYNAPLPTPSNGGELNKSEQERLKNTPTDKITAALEDSKLSPALRKQYVAELRARVANDSSMDPATKKEVERILTKAETGPITAEEGDTLSFALDLYNDEKLKGEGLAPHQFKLGTEEEVKSMSTKELLNMSMADMSPEDRKRLAAELKERGKDLTGDDKKTLDAAAAKLEKGDELSFADVQALGKTLPENRASEPDKEDYEDVPDDDPRWD
jgi:DNA segregation ATPase FtsK/SpoIIIE-like protein